MAIELYGLAGMAATAYILYLVGLVIYRLHFHPLAGFPGPKLAAVTYLYEFYYDVFARGGGQYTNEVERMHDRLGPVVRVTPDEVHIRDAEWGSVLYAGPGKTRIKDPRLSEVAGTGNGCFGTSSPHLHRPRRQPVHAFYSRSSISRMQGKIWQRADHLRDVLHKHMVQQSIVEGRIVFLGWSNDSLRTFTFGHCLSLLDNVDKARDFHAVIHVFGLLFGWLHIATGATKLALSLPPSLFDYIKTPLNTLIYAHVDMIKAAQEAREKQRENKPISEADLELGEKESEYLFQAILASNLPESEKSAQRLAHEGLEMLLAGSDPAARTMIAMTYHLVANPSILARLRVELRGALPNASDTVDIRTLENLPFLNACVKETLRIGQTTDHRFGMIAPDEDLVYTDGSKTWVMRRGVTVSMTPARAGLEPRWFPAPRVFQPERWLAQDGSVAEQQRLAAMNRAFMPFAKGTRNCLGEFFALTEIRVAAARIYRTFDFEFYDTERERDIDVSWNHMSGEPSRGSLGLRFKVTGLLE